MRLFIECSLAAHIIPKDSMIRDDRIMHMNTAVLPFFDLISIPLIPSSVFIIFHHLSGEGAEPYVFDPV